MILHIVIYFFLIFVIPFLYKAVWLYHAADGFLSRNLIFSLEFFFSSIIVLILDVIQVVIWSKLNKIFKYSMRNIILVYVYNKLLTPISGFIAYFHEMDIYPLLPVWFEFRFYNMIYMFIFTLICFSLFENHKIHLKILSIILLFFMMIPSVLYIYIFFA